MAGRLSASVQRRSPARTGCLTSCQAVQALRTRGVALSLAGVLAWPPQQRNCFRKGTEAPKRSEARPRGRPEQENRLRSATKGGQSKADRLRSRPPAATPPARPPPPPTAYRRPLADPLPSANRRPPATQLDPGGPTHRVALCGRVHDKPRLL